MTCPGAAGGANAGDIIDLDRYMRTAVRRSGSDTTDDDHIERLVVDGGGGGGVGKRGTTKAVPAAGSSSAECAARPHHKRFSHDSGLSDGSYAPRARRPHRRMSAADGTGGRCGREGREGRDSRAPRAANNSSNSLREFRAVCERALLDQQQQIARVAFLCEQLTERRTRLAPAGGAAVAPVGPGTDPDTSDISSSSCSTKDQRRKDKHRADECKTYKIIMNKLDELNRLFAARGRPPPSTAARVALTSAPRNHAPSISASVSDKLVATEPPGKANATKPISQVWKQKERRVVERAAGGGECSVVGSVERRGLRAVTHAFALDIAPQDVTAPDTRHGDRPNVTTESIVECGSTCEEYISSTCDPRCGFDLGDPGNFYAHAKRLQALHAPTRRSKSAGYEASRGGRLDKRLGERLDKRPSSREASLCALCRGYWRAVRRYIGAQLTGPSV